MKLFSKQPYQQRPTGFIKIGQVGENDWNIGHVGQIYRHNMLYAWEVERGSLLWFFAGKKGQRIM